MGGGRRGRKARARRMARVVQRGKGSQRRIVVGVVWWRSISVEGRRRPVAMPRAMASESTAARGGGGRRRWRAGRVEASCRKAGTMMACQARAPRKRL